MAHEKHVDHPDGLEVWLRQAMSVEPSAEFLPRVRERILTAEPRGFLFPWRFAIAAGTVAVALLVALWPAPRPAPVLVPPAVRASGPTAAEPVVRPLDALQEPPSPRRMPGQRSSARAGTVAARRFRAPVVIVDDRQRAALSGLMRLVAEGKLTDQAFAHTIPQSMGAIREQVIPLSVTPVEVNPIPVGGVSQSGAERN